RAAVDGGTAAGGRAVLVGGAAARRAVRGVGRLGERHGEADRGAGHVAGDGVGALAGEERVGARVHRVAARDADRARRIGGEGRARGGVRARARGARAGAHAARAQLRAGPADAARGRGATVGVIAGAPDVAQ